MNESYVIWTRYQSPKGTVIRHVFGPYPTRAKALTAMKNMIRDNIEYGNDMDNAEVYVTKMIGCSKPEPVQPS